MQQPFYPFAQEYNARHDGGKFLRREYYQFAVTMGGDLRIAKNDGGINGGLIVLAPDMPEMLQHLKDNFLDSDKSFLIGKRAKYRSVKKVLEILQTNTAK